MDNATILTILQEYGLLTESDVSYVISEEQNQGNSIGKILVDSGILRENDLYRFIVNELGMNPDFNYEDRHFNIAGLSIPRYDINGDFYGIFNLGEGKMAVTLSDVAGKGLEAGILAIRLAYMLRKEINLKNIVPATIMKKINQESLSFFRSDRFATFIVFILDLYHGTAEYSCAGSPPILVYRNKTNTIESLETAGLPIGIIENYGYQGRKLSLEKGDSVLFYTDGAYEAENLRGQMYGLERIHRMLRTHSGRPARTMLKGMLRDIRKFSFFRGLSDDTTYVVIKKLH